MLAIRIIKHAQCACTSGVQPAGVELKRASSSLSAAGRGGKGKACHLRNLNCPCQASPRRLLPALLRRALNFSSVTCSQVNTKVDMHARTSTRTLTFLKAWIQQ